MTTTAQKLKSAFTALNALYDRVAALETAAVTPPAARNVEQEEHHLVGLWVAAQRDGGAATIDGAHLDAVREGVRLALSVR